MSLPQPRKTRLNPVYLRVICDALRGAVTHGTAVRANSQLISIAGKTGTAENSPCPSNPQGLNHTWFTCFAPAEQPEVVVVVFLEKSGGLAGETAVPLAREFLEAYIEETSQKREAPAGAP